LFELNQSSATLRKAKLRQRRDKASRNRIKDLQSFHEARRSAGLSPRSYFITRQRACLELLWCRINSKSFRTSIMRPTRERS